MNDPAALLPDLFEGRKKPPLIFLLNPVWCGCQYVLGVGQCDVNLLLFLWADSFPWEPNQLPFSGAQGSRVQSSPGASPLPKPGAPPKPSRSLAGFRNHERSSAPAGRGDAVPRDSRQAGMGEGECRGGREDHALQHREREAGKVVRLFRSLWYPKAHLLVHRVVLVCAWSTLLATS